MKLFFLYCPGPSGFCLRAFILIIKHIIFIAIIIKFNNDIITNTINLCSFKLEGILYLHSAEGFTRSAQIQGVNTGTGM